MLNASQPKTSFILAPAGTHIARLYELIQIGTNEDEYQGQPILSNKIRLTFELPEETKVFKEGQEAKPIVISEEYTLSMGSKANLRKLVEGIIGTSLLDTEAYAFDIETLLGQTCLLTIKHTTSAKGNTYSKIASASPLMKSQKAPAPINPIKKLTYSDWNQKIFEDFPDFIKEKMMTSSEYKMKFESTLTPAEKDQIKKTKEELRAHQASYDAQVDSEIPF